MMASSVRQHNRVAVLGAGISGLQCAKELRKAGVDVTLFEKSRTSLGGRMATRTVTVPSHECLDVFAFDHGAQYFTAREPAFVSFVEEEAIPMGAAAEWKGFRLVSLKEGRIDEIKNSNEPRRYVGTPGMSSLARLALAPPLLNEGRIKSGCRVNKMNCKSLSSSGTPLEWQLESDEGVDLGNFDQVILTMPPMQTTQLLMSIPFSLITDEQIKNELLNLLDTIKQANMMPCWAVMLGFAQPQELPFDAAFVNDDSSPLSWICRDNAKPQRGTNNEQSSFTQKECWLLHGKAQWSLEHLEDQPSIITEHLTQAFYKAVENCYIKKDDKSSSSSSTFIPLISVAHRWRYAIPSPPLENSSNGYIFNKQLGIGIAGDWCNGSRVEGAFMSGDMIAKQLLSNK